MSSSDFIFVANNLALDFLNTESLAGESVVERLTSGEKVLDWLQEAAPRSLRTSEASPNLLELAIRLREEMKECLGMAKLGKPYGADTVNLILEKGAPTPNLGWDDKSGRFIVTERYGAITDEVLLHPIAHAFVHLVTDIDLNLVKQCEAPDCILMFHDQTKSHRRRWCSMALCGNRMKVAAHRTRAQQKLR
ncbi:ABATE domain-containing protein [Microbulbifer sp. HZ11]|uniref:CGNR zinc finger domain-containing protein n=1 Tax=Microbulbifer sp. HZ11 TaxID=1453501 RepID=UPI0005BD6C87|nr:ABATE domain-containing protein [Microbulbifer sp. HZ11]